MRMLVEVTMPHATFNQAVKDGSAGLKIKRILEAQKPEAVYFLERNGVRTGILIVDLVDTSGIPALAEPWFLTFNADVQIRPCMLPADLEKGNLAETGKQWG